MPDLPYGVFERPDPIDLDTNDIPAFEITRRVEADADTGGRAGRDDVAGAERHARRDGGDDGRDVEDEVARIRALPDVAVDEAANARVGEIDLVAGNGKGPHGTERILRLRHQPLAVAGLQVAGGDV